MNPIAGLKVGVKVQLLEDHWAVKNGTYPKGTTLAIEAEPARGVFRTTATKHHLRGLLITNGCYPETALRVVKRDNSLRTFYVNVSQRVIFKYPVKNWLGAYKLRAHTLEEAYRMMEDAKWTI